jgi:hypothetical protein
MADEPEPNEVSGSSPSPSPVSSPASSGASPSPAVGPDRGGLIVGGVLIVLGLLFLLERAFDVQFGRFGWPLFVIVPGVLLLAASLAVGGREASGLAVAGAITTVTGLVLAFQNATGLWATWAYAWALVGPAATGLGLVFYGALRGFPDLVSAGIKALGTGLALFAGFGLFFEGIIGLSGEPFLAGSELLPYLLIGLGVVLVGWGIVRGRQPA